LLKDGSVQAEIHVLIHTDFKYYFNKVKLSLCLKIIKHYAMKTYGGVDE
jgi:hypothetical protein